MQPSRVLMPHLALLSLRTAPAQAPAPLLTHSMSQATPQRTPSYARTAAAASPRSPPAPAPSFTRQLSTASSAAGSSAGSTAADRKKRSHRLRDYYGLGKGAAPSRHPDGLDLGTHAPRRQSIGLSSLFSGGTDHTVLPQITRRPLIPRHTFKNSRRTPPCPTSFAARTNC